MPLFKIWSGDRSKRKAVVANSLDELLSKGEIKLGLDELCVKAVCETDGTEIEDDDVLLLMTGEVLMLLMEGEVWSKPGLMVASSNSSSLSASRHTTQEVHIDIEEPVRFGNGSDSGTEHSQSSANSTKHPASAPQLTSKHTEDTRELKSSMGEALVCKRKRDSTCNNEGAMVKTAAVVLSPWPTGKFQLPKLRASLAKTLSEGKLLSPAEKSALMDHLYEEMTKYTFRPKPSNYEEVISTLLRVYPYLKRGLKGRDALDYWKSSITNKFRNERKRHEKDNPLAQPLKQIKKQKKEMTGAKAAYGIKYYLPPFSEGEGKDTCEQHIKIMQAEDMKTRQDVGKIEHLMNLTLPDRREKIVTQRRKIVEIKKDYPCLFNEDEMFKEFERLTEANISERMLQGLKKYAKPLLMMKKSQETAEEDGDEMTTFGRALAIIPELLGEKLEHVIRPEGKDLNAPGGNQGAASARISHKGTNILKSSAYNLIVENEEVCECKTFLTAFELLFVVHYAFDLVYYKKVNNTMTFIQKVVLNFEDDTRTPTKVINLLLKLNRVIEENEK